MSLCWWWPVLSPLFGVIEVVTVVVVGITAVHDGCCHCDLLTQVAGW